MNVLKTAAASVKKERKLPAVALDLLRLSLREGKFPRFWKEVVEQGLLKKQFWPARCVGGSQMCVAQLGVGVESGQVRRALSRLSSRPQLSVFPPAGRCAAPAV